MVGSAPIAVKLEGNSLEENEMAFISTGPDHYYEGPTVELWTSITLEECNSIHWEYELRRIVAIESRNKRVISCDPTIF